MTSETCPAVNKESLAAAGLFAVENPFLLPTEGVFASKALPNDARIFEPGAFQTLDDSWSEQRGSQCRWDMLVFDSGDCQSCELQWESIDSFQREKFGSLRHLEFVMVIGADRMNTRVVEGVRGRIGMPFLFDSSGHLEQQLTVQATPFVALVGPDGYVRAYFPGLVNVDAPGFEVLSHHLAGAPADAQNSVFPSVLLVLAGLLILALIGALLSAVVRIR